MALYKSEYKNLNMTECMRAWRTEAGIIEIFEACMFPQSWDQIKSECEEVEFVERLVGWGMWTALYRVRRHGDLYMYAVSE